jgi:hypothetical protein
MQVALEDQPPRFLGINLDRTKSTAEPGYRPGKSKRDDEGVWALGLGSLVSRCQATRGSISHIQSPSATYILISHTYLIPPSWSWAEVVQLSQGPATLL